MVYILVVKFLSNNIRENIEKSIELEDIFESIICDIRALGDLENETFNGGEYNLIDPDIMLVKAKLKMRISSALFVFTLQKQSYEKDQGEEVRTLEVTINSEADENFYSIKVAIKTILKKYFKEVFIPTDTQNEELCSYLYRDIHRTENNFREAINAYMLRKFGVGWFKNNIKEEYQKKSAQYVGWYNRKYEDFKDIQSELFNLQTDDLIEMLEKSYIDQLNKTQVDAITDLKSKLGDQATLVLNESYINMESIWDADIKQLLPEEFKDLWKEFSNMRNMIAHNKSICLRLKQDIIDMVANLNKIIGEFREKVDRRLTSIEKQEAITLLDDLQDGLYCEEAGIQQLQESEDIIEEIFEHEDIQELFSCVEEYEYKYLDIVAELDSSIEDIRCDIYYYEQLPFEKIKELALNLYSILTRFGFKEDKLKEKLIELSIDEDVKDLIIEDLTSLFDSLQFDVIDIVRSNYFDPNSIIFSYRNLFNESVKLVTDGCISPESGSTNDINVKLYLNDEVIEYGYITKSYGEYLIHEDGYAMPITEDGLEINITEIQNLIKDHFELTICRMKKLTEFISSLR